MLFGMCFTALRWIVYAHKGEQLSFCHGMTDRGAIRRINTMGVSDRKGGAVASHAGWFMRIKRVIAGEVPLDSRRGSSGNVLTWMAVLRRHARWSITAHWIPEPSGRDPSPLAACRLP
ncbi:MULTISPECIES: hypothetical protein, partial [Burkholderia]|uniref:hypothetical protein n=1 Tax=Burkholderia TaxID=32008 RepID=UPI001969B2C3